jgi:DNA-binding MarR family transcriptional regulator
VSVKKNVVDFPAAGKVGSKHAFVERWKHEALFKKGYIPLPVLFLHHYAELKPFPLTSGEALFVLHLMEFKWDAENPFPGYKTLAKRMGITDKMARRHAQSLEQKHYLIREIRIGQTNRFDLTPLFDALLKAIVKKDAAKPDKKAL